jgi:hypothetical protein
VSIYTIINLKDKDMSKNDNLRKIIEVRIAILSAIAGALTANAMQ